MSTLRTLLTQLIRYGLSGGAAFVVDKCLFLLCTGVLGWGKYAATTAGFSVGLCITYLLSISWVFQERKFESRSLEVGLFVLIGLVGLLLMNVFVWFFSEPVGIGNDFLCNLAATVLVTLWNFFAKRQILFTRRKDNPTESIDNTNIPKQ